MKEEDLKERIRALETRVDKCEAWLLEIVTAMELSAKAAKKTANILEKLKGGR